jgi:hypothetical protein
MPRPITTTKFVPNPAAIPELAASAEIGATLDEAAEDVELAAKNIAAVEAFDTGAYMRSIEAKDARVDQHGHQVAAVEADVPYAAAVEYGNLNRPGVHTLTRAAEASGLRIKSKSKRKRKR